MEREDLEHLLRETDKYVQTIFDTVGCLRRVDFLHQVYDFRNTVEAALSKTGEAA